jgi:hypothetical protein
MVLKKQSYDAKIISQCNVDYIESNELETTPINTY